MNISTKNKLFRYITLNSIAVWLVFFALLPLVLLLITSFLSYDPDTLVRLPFTTINYSQLVSMDYARVMLRSFVTAGGCTLFCLILGYPLAFIIARSHSRYKSLLLLLIIIPFWISSLIRTYAMMAVLKAKGMLNTLLLALGIIHHPLQLMYSQTAVFIGLVYNLLPFMVLPLYANIEKLDNSLIEAARDLGASHLTTFIRVILPLTTPGIIAGILLVFLPAMTLFYIPVILGGAKSILLGNLIENEFLQASNWPLGASISIMLIVIMAIMIMLHWRMTSKKDREALL